MEKENEAIYTGKILYIGIDVHKKRRVVTVTRRYIAKEAFYNFLHHEEFCE